MEFQAWGTWTLAMLSIGVFIWQWLPLLPMLLQAVLSLQPQKLLAFLLVAPNSWWQLVSVGVDCVDVCRVATRCVWHQSCQQRIP